MTTPYTPGGEVAAPIDLTAMAIGTRLATRDGRPARLLANDLRGIAPCVIAVDLGGDNEQLHNLYADGSMSEGSEHPHDIVGIERPKHRVRIIICDDPDGPPAVFGYRDGEPGFTRPRDAFVMPVIADAIVEVEELTPSPAHPGARHDD